MTTNANEFSFMPSAGPNDKQQAELLVFNTSGKVLVVSSSKDGLRALPQQKVEEGHSLADTAVNLSLNLGINVTKLAPIYGHQKNGNYKVTFLVQGIDPSAVLSITPFQNKDPVQWADLVSLCTKEASPESEYYRGMLAAIFSLVFPVIAA